MSHEREINWLDFLPNLLTCLFDLNANQPHDNIKFYIVDFLRSYNFRAFVEYGVNDIVRVDNKGKSYKGRLDFYATLGDMEIVGEIDHSVPRKKLIENDLNILMLLRYLFCVVIRLSILKRYRELKISNIIW